MARTLIVANQTVTNPRLVERVKQLAAEQPDSEFVLLVPATHARHLLRRESDEQADAVARRRAAEAAELFAREGVPLAAAKVGVESPIEAIDAEVASGSGYDGFVISTLPSLHSRWLLQNVPGKVKERYNLPVHTVEVPPAQMADWGTLASDG